MVQETAPSAFLPSFIVSFLLPFLFPPTFVFFLPFFLSLFIPVVFLTFILFSSLRFCELCVLHTFLPSFLLRILSFLILSFYIFSHFPLIPSFLPFFLIFYLPPLHYCLLWTVILSTFIFVLLPSCLVLLHHYSHCFYSRLWFALHSTLFSLSGTHHPFPS